MAQPLLVRLDLVRIAANLPRAGDPTTEDEVRQMLVENFFEPLRNDWWLCEKDSLRSLDRSEILEQRRFQ